MVLRPSLLIASIHYMNGGMEEVEKEVHGRQSSVGKTHGAEDMAESEIFTDGR